ncbi:MAG: DNA polymerase III subunit gamma/tau [Clostridia bacterium]|nr:DNA polymerase III subunit gamma/tau [Clostridia bacterium]
MAMQALYRAWRPSRFADVYGQDAVVTTLKNQIVSGRVSHAYLFCGSRGTGKTTMAKLFARAVNCTGTSDGEPCEACETCAALLPENNMDIIEMDAASNNGVDEIRDLRSKIGYPPQHGRYRVYIVDEVHMLSAGAFNALLKTLEEPPAHAIFILATTEPQRLPATVLSRCQRYDFHRIPVPAIESRMRAIIAAEKADVTPEAQSIIARSAEGALRDALSLLDTCLAYGGGSVDAALVREVLGSADRGFLFAFVDRLIQSDIAGTITGIDELMRSGRDPQVFTRDVTGHLRALLIAKVTGDAFGKLLDLADAEAEEFKRQGDRVSRERLLALLELFIASEADMKWSSQPRVALEITSARACLPDDSANWVALMQRVELLERKAETAVPVPAQKAIPPAPLQEAAQPVPVRAAAPAASPSPSPPQDDKALWEAVTKLVQQDAALYASFAQGEFGGINGDSALLLFSRDKEIFRNVLLKNERQQRVEAMLSEAAGRPLKLLLQLRNEKKEDMRLKTDVMESIFDVFGRENVQVVDDAP